ncbi:MAG: ParB/RepB/Spo0J family partition protein [Desulfocucumaceae bacterium]
MIKRGLGKGLDALLPGSAGEKDGGLREIRIVDVMPNPRQPRQVVNAEKLSELAGSIQEHGIVQPIVVRPVKDGKYELIAGERRWKACQSLGMEKIPAVIRDYGDLEAAAVALIENVQRENLNPLEEARAYRILMEDFDLTQEDVSKRVGKSRPFVGNMVRLLTLPGEIQKMLIGSLLTPGHARALLGIQDKDRQILAAKRIIKNHMNVRQAESLAKSMASPKARPGRVRVKNREYLNLERDLANILPATVKLKEKKDGGGRMIVDFKDPGEMVRFVRLLKEGREAASS